MYVCIRPVLLLCRNPLFEIQISSQRFRIGFGRSRRPTCARTCTSTLSPTGKRSACSCRSGEFVTYPNPSARPPCARSSTSPGRTRSCSVVPPTLSLILILSPLSILILSHGFSLVYAGTDNPFFPPPKLSTSEIGVGCGPCYSI